MKSYAVVGVIEAVLLIALFAIILSAFQLVYVPEIMKDKEANHMDQVENQFYQMKFAIDLLASGRINSSISIPITLGSREIPYLITSPAPGDISIVKNILSIEVQNSSEHHIFAIDGIRYNANNAYYEKQSYLLEGGSVILEQATTESMRIPIDLTSTLKGSFLKIRMEIVNITGYGGRYSASGYDTTYVRLNYSSAYTFNFYGVTDIKLRTSHINAWYNFLNSTINGSVASIIKGDGYVQITPKSGYSIELQIDMIKIYAQIGLGWIGKLK